MRRWLPGAAEVVRVSGEWFAEVVLPNAVHDGSCGERVLVVGDPPGKGETASVEVIGDEVRVVPGSAFDGYAEGAKDAGRNFLAGSLKSPSGKDV